jgi:hypothetical protein
VDVVNPVQTPPAPPPDPGARRSLRARFAGGPVARTIAAGDLRAFRYIRGTLHHPGAAKAVARFSHLGEHAACWIALGSAGYVVDVRHRSEWGRGLRAVGVTYVLNTGRSRTFPR